MAPSIVALHSESGDHPNSISYRDKQDMATPYLEKCQVDTPVSLVRAAWRHVGRYRQHIGKVVDFGAGDGRFSRFGNYERYIGYEVDKTRCRPVGSNAKIINSCAFERQVVDADLCIGNPPFVRNQDLPSEWRVRVADLLRERTGVRVSGLANAWQYFFLLGLASIKSDGLCVLVIPYEWVSRPSVRGIRSFIRSQKWTVDVYRLVDQTFKSVLTTASITIVDKSRSLGTWRYFEETEVGTYKRMSSASGASDGVLSYVSASSLDTNVPRAKRGLSPGTQKVFVLTEGARVANGLRISSDVVPCVTSLRPLCSDETVLDRPVFHRRYRDEGLRCWLIRTDRSPSDRLRAYLESVPKEARQTKTCLERETWWMFKMPAVADILMSQTFKDSFPKAVKNSVGAIAVGGVCGVSNVTSSQLEDIVSGLRGMDVRNMVVSYAKGLRKLEINQLNCLFEQRFQRVPNSNV